jgi:NAD(P)-dependent dehydrogenase (short-subunit alcohol dehydrogenase family)
MPDRQAGRHAVVVGASTGIGRAIALRLAAEGARVSALSRDTVRLEQVVAEAGEDAIALQVDVRDRASVGSAFEQAAERHGTIDVLVVNSGICMIDANGDEEGSAFTENFATNVLGNVYAVEAARRHLTPGPDPRQIVLICSTFARIPVPGYAAYGASKAAQLSYMRTLALELAPEEIYVNAICPGLVDTELAYREGVDLVAAAEGISRAEATEISLAPYPIKRMSQPEEIAGMVAWLSSPDARGVTGQGIDVNHGLFMA